MFTAELLSLAIRVSVLLVAGCLAARLLERKSAAMAHRALVMTLACTLLLPLIVKTVPVWQLTQPAWMAFSVTAVENTSSDETAEVDSTNFDRLPVRFDENASEAAEVYTVDRNPSVGDSFASSILGEAITSRADTEPASAENSLSSLSLVRSPQQSDSRGDMTLPASSVAPASWTWAELGVSAWLFFAGLLVCRLLVSLIRLVAFVKHCTLASDEIATSANDIASRLRLKSHVNVVLSGPDAMPTGVQLMIASKRSCAMAERSIAARAPA